MRWRPQDWTCACSCQVLRSGCISLGSFDQDVVRHRVMCVHAMLMIAVVSAVRQHSRQLSGGDVYACDGSSGYWTFVRQQKRMADWVHAAL